MAVIQPHFRSSLLCELFTLLRYFRLIPWLIAKSFSDIWIICFLLLKSIDPHKFKMSLNWDMLSLSDIKLSWFWLVNSRWHPFRVLNIILTLLSLISLTTYHKKDSLKILGHYRRIFVNLEKCIKIIELVLLIIGHFFLHETHVVKDSMRMVNIKVCLGDINCRVWISS